MISAPMASRSSCRRALTEPWVPTGMNAGANVEVVFLHPPRIPPRVLERQTQPATSSNGIMNIESMYKTPKIGCSDSDLKLVCRDCSHACTGRSMPPALTKAAKTSRKINTATSKRPKNLIRRFVLRAICTSWVPGIEASKETFSCGQAWTQSRQEVQSMLPVLRGTKSCNSHPCCRSFPRMQSCVLHEPQIARLRTPTSTGEIRD